MERTEQMRYDECAFIAHGVADAATAAQLRRAFSDWLQQRFTLDEQRLGDAVLATYEALANAVEFAYTGAPTPGSMTLEALHEDNDDRLHITITDDGRWRDTVPTLRDNTRGRGIPLMKALADHAAIERRDTGTTVHLRFDDVRTGDPENFAESA
jgi:anti-sigma regulatory factor (Ser/Thr protein kinase)